jgi:hypothetical protein
MGDGRVHRIKPPKALYAAVRASLDQYVRISDARQDNATAELRL